jgi:glycosyltransferase involved in cell wall biosynthesis
MRILVIHNQLWAHYKSVLFEEIQREISLHYPEGTFLVAQIALYEASRATMQGNSEVSEFDYPYQVLHPRSLDTVSLWERIKGVFTTFHSFRPDVLTITGYYDWAQVLLLLYAKARGKKVVISVESSQMDRARNGFKELIKKTIFKLTDSFFCFGTSSVNYLRTLGVPEGKIVVRRAAVVDNTRIRQRYNFARSIQIPPKQRGRNFIYVGRLAVEKNLLILLNAFKKCVNADQPLTWRLLLVGDGPQRKVLEDFVLKNNLGSQVHFTGGTGWKVVPDYLAQADVLILPSLSEPWGLVVNEALVCGMPVIVSRQCGCAGDLVFHTKNGFLFDPLDQQALVNSMQYYANHPDDVILHGSVSEQIIAPFSPRSVAHLMVSHYHKLSH